LLNRTIVKKPIGTVGTQYGKNKDVISDLVEYAKGLGHRMVMKGRRNVDNIHKGVFPLPIR
jgi:hypothetical protein